MATVYSTWQLVHGFMIHHNEVIFNQIFGGLLRQKPYHVTNQENNSREAHIAQREASNSIIIFTSSI